MSLTLYYHPLSSYCHKALIALYELGVPFEPKLTNLGDATDRATLSAIWPLCKFPVLRDHARERDVAESTIIIEYLDHHFAGAQRLIPGDWETALEARLWDRFFDNYVQGPMNQMVVDRMSGGQGDMSRARATLDTAYAMLETHMELRIWAAGETFSVADCAAAPALFYAESVQPFPANCAHLRAYTECLYARPSVARVLAEAKPYFSMFPFQEALAPRFR